MKIKNLLISAVVLAVVFAGATLGNSFYAEKRYNEQVAQASEWLKENMPQVQIESSTYDRGLLSSSSRVLINITTNDISGKLLLDSQIQTGPWLGGASFGLAKFDTKINLDPANTPPELVQALGGKDLMTARTLLGFGKNFNTEVYGAPFDTNVPGAQILYNGFVASFKTSDSREKADLNVKFPYLSVQETKPGNTSEVVLVNWGYEVRGAELQNLTRWFSSGYHNFSFDNFHVSDASGVPIVQVGKTSLINEPKIERDLYSMRSSLSLTGRYLGKPVLIELVSNAKNINYPIYTQLMQAAQSGNLDEMMRIVEGKGMDFLKFSPSFTMDPFVFEYNGEQARFSLRSSIGNISEDELKGSPGMILMSKLNLQMDAQIPVSFVNPQLLQEPMYSQFQGLIRQGIFIRQGNVYTSNFSMNSGSFELNGGRF